MRAFMLGLVLGGVVCAQTAEIPVLTVCEALEDLQKYSGKVVIVVGVSAASMEGSWLRAECGFKVQSGERSFETVISTAFSPEDYAPAPTFPLGFSWNRTILHQKLDVIKRTTKRGRREHWAAHYGRLETQLKSWKEGDAIHTLLGFGHLGLSPAELVSPEGSYLELK